MYFSKKLICRKTEEIQIYFDLWLVLLILDCTYVILDFKLKMSFETICYLLWEAKYTFSSPPVFFSTFKLRCYHKATYVS
jgi:hypothetical protein